MAASIGEVLQKKVDDIASIVYQEEQWLKAERQAIQAERAAMEAELKPKTDMLEVERAAMEEELKSKTTKVEVEFESKSAQLEKERAAFEAEKEVVAATNNSTKSKVKLDVGRTIYHASRTTLTSMPGSMLEAMFSGRHGLEEDEDGRVFIDRDGSTFKLVLEYLRSPMSFSLEGLSKREVTSCEAEFDYYGLPSPVPSPVRPGPPLCLGVTTDPHRPISAQLDNDRRCCTISCQRSSRTSGWAIGDEVLAANAVWKMHVNQCSGGLLAMGVIANPTPPTGATTFDATFAGWCTSPTAIRVRGHDQYSPGWQGWQENDEAIFGLDAPARTLAVRCKRTGRCHTFSDLARGMEGHWRFCVVMNGVTAVVLSCPTDDERALVQ